MAHEALYNLAPTYLISTWSHNEILMDQPRLLMQFQISRSSRTVHFAFNLSPLIPIQKSSPRKPSLSSQEEWVALSFMFPQCLVYHSHGISHIADVWVSMYSPLPDPPVSYFCKIEVYIFKVLEMLFFKKWHAQN